MITVDPAILLYATRYAIGRRTYAVGDVCNALVANAGALDNALRDLLSAEIRLCLEAKEAGGVRYIGDVCDLESWQRALEALEREGELMGTTDQPVDYVCDDCGHRWKQPEVADSYVPCPSCGKPSGALV